MQASVTQEDWRKLAALLVAKAGNRVEIPEAEVLELLTGMEGKVLVYVERPEASTMVIEVIPQSEFEARFPKFKGSSPV